MSNFVAIILACLNCRIYPKLRRVFSRSCAATDSRRLSSKRESKFFSPSCVHFLQLQLVTEDSKEMFKIARGTFRVVVFCSLKLLFLILYAIVAVATGNCSCYSKGAFLWDDLDQDQWPEITRIMMHLRNRWILARFALRMHHDPGDHLTRIFPKERTTCKRHRLRYYLQVWLLSSCIPDE